MCIFPQVTLGRRARKRQLSTNRLEKLSGRRGASRAPDLAVRADLRIPIRWRGSICGAWISFRLWRERRRTEEARTLLRSTGGSPKDRRSKTGKGSPGRTRSVAKYASSPLNLVGSKGPLLALTGGARCPKAFPQLRVKLPCGAPTPIRAHDPIRTAIAGGSLIY
jgi:hypothetical protein